MRSFLIGLMATLDHTTPYWQVALFMSVMGVGVGALVQNIVLAVQNTVDVSQVGATSASVSFFRSLGGAVGVAVLGAVLANHVTSHVADGLLRVGLLLDPDDPRDAARAEAALAELPDLAAAVGGSVGPPEALAPARRALAAALDPEGILR